MAAFGLMFLWVAAYCYYGDSTSGMERLRGHAVVVENVKIEMGSTRREAGWTVHFPLKVKNITSGSVKVVGISAGCNCIHFENIPVTLEAYAETELKGELHWREEFQQGFRYEVLMIFDKGTAPVPFVIEG